MGQVLHKCATTTHAVRAAIQRSKALVAEIAEQYGVNQKTVRKWRSRKSVEDAPMGPKEVRSTVLSPEEEAVCVAFRKHTLLPLDDCLYTLQATIPHLTRSSLHRLFQRHDISRLPDVEGEKKPKKKFKKYPSVTSISTSRKSAPRKASFKCSWQSIARRSSPSSSCMNGQPAKPPPTF